MKVLEKGLITIVLFLVNSFAQGAGDTAYFYIAKNGNDAADGSIQKPFATLEGTRNYLRSVKTKLGGKPVVVYLRAGSYFIQNTVRFNEADILPGNAALIFKAYLKEYVSLNGGLELRSRDMEKLSGNTADNRFPLSARKQILKINLKKSGLSNYGSVHSYGFRRPIVPATPELFINKQPLIIARYPNDTGILLQKGNDMQRSIYTSDTRISQWVNAKDAWVGGFFNWAWADDQLPIESIDPKKGTIRVKEAPMFGFDVGLDFRRWYLFNVPEALDTPGEYYIDRETGVLYFYPPAGRSDLKAEISVLQDPMIAVSGMQNVLLRNLTFENMRGIAVYMERGQNNSVANCTFRNIGMMAVVIGKGVAPFKNYIHNGTSTLVSETVGNLYEHLYENTATDREAGRNNGIKNCLIYNTGSGGVSLGGGNRKTLEAASNYVINCSIHDFNRLGKTYKGAVNVDGVGNSIEGNHFYNAEQLTVYLMGNNHSVQYNEIDHACRYVDDMGAVYAGYNPSEAGNRISSNYFHHILPAKNGYRVAGIFLDDGASNFVVEKNTFYQTGTLDFGAISIHGGRGFDFINNVFVDCDQAIRVLPWDEERWNKTLRSALWQTRLHQAVDIDSKVYRQSYPQLSKAISAPIGQSKAERNLAVGCTFFGNKDLIVSNNWITNSNPGFVNLTKADFRLKPNATAFKMISGFESTGIEKAGALTSIAGNPFDPFALPEAR